MHERITRVSAAIHAMQRTRSPNDAHNIMLFVNTLAEYANLLLTPIRGEHDHALQLLDEIIAVLGAIPTHLRNDALERLMISIELRTTNLKAQTLPDVLCAGDHVTLYRDEQNRLILVATRSDGDGRARALKHARPSGVLLDLPRVQIEIADPFSLQTMETVISTLSFALGFRFRRLSPDEANEADRSAYGHQTPRQRFLYVLEDPFDSQFMCVFHTQGLARP